MKRTLVAAAAAAVLGFGPLAHAQVPRTKEPAKPAASAPAAEAMKPAASGPLATVNGVAIPRQRADLILRERTQQGQPETDQLRAAVREELINREVILQESNRTGASRKPDLLAELELVRQTVIVQAYLRDWAQKHPVSEADLQKEYDRARAQTGATEYRARHILVAAEDEAKKLIAEIRKGAKFEELAQKASLDEGTRTRGGDLDWNVPGIFDKAFADALVKLEKGKLTESPVHTRFGFHVIRLDDVRAVSFPPLADVKPQIRQRLTQQKVDGLIRELRAKAKIE